MSTCLNKYEGDFGRQSDEPSPERAFMALTQDVEPELDAEFMEIMVAAGDQALPDVCHLASSGNRPCHVILPAPVDV